MVVSVAAISFPTLAFLYYKPYINLQNKVESFVIHYGNGDNVTVTAQSTEGKTLLSGCEAYMSNIDCHLMCPSDYKYLLWEINHREFVEIKLKDIYSFTFYCKSSISEHSPRANRIFIGLEEFPDVYFTVIENQEVVSLSGFSAGWGVYAGRSELRNTVSTIIESMQ